MKVDKISHGNYRLQDNNTIKANVGFNVMHDDGQRWDLVTLDVFLEGDNSLTVGQIQERALERAYQVLDVIQDHKVSADV